MSMVGVRRACSWAPWRGGVMAVAALSAASFSSDAGAQNGRTSASQSPVIGALDGNGWIRGDVATLRGLDKITAETRDFQVRLGETVEFGALLVSMPTPCGERPPEETPETVAGLEISERPVTTGGRNLPPVEIFSGWMFASSPALNPLEHGVFDVWVLSCDIANASMDASTGP